MVWRLLGAIGLTGTSLLLLAAAWVVTHLRDLPEVADKDLRTVPVVATEEDAWQTLSNAQKLLQVDDSQAEQLTEWSRGRSWDEAAATALLARNAAAVDALAEADAKPALALPPDRTSRPDPFDKSAIAEPILEDTWAWRKLGQLRVLRALLLARHGDTTNALNELLRAARFGNLVQGAADAGLVQYMAACSLNLWRSRV